MKKHTSFSGGNPMIADDLKIDLCNRLQDAEHNLKSGRTLLRRNHAEVRDDLLCHINHVIRNMEEARGLLAPEEMEQPTLFQDEQSLTLDLDHAVTVNGTEHP